ncbi:MAG: RluA family pseudouridine synthase [Oscillospiraceae bacterium]|jgi:23S rRNA pseudouridine1911/1915/1917 synthase|nr:RluA family pseudouridine synthase [Oscillospiraceae bacterium]
MITTLTPSEPHVGTRLDVYLASAIPNLSRSAATRLIESGGVILRGKPAPKSHKLALGDVFTVALPEEPETAEVAAQDIALDVVYEDADVIAVNKPRGMVVHPAPGHADGTLVNALLHHCGGSLSGIGGVIRPGIVHRIDKDTSGLILAAKNDFSHRRLSAQLADRSLSREYETVVRGNIRDDGGTVNAPIGRSRTDRKKMAVIDDGSRARGAVTHYTVIARYVGYTHLACKLETGRTHQIRVHMAHIGHPVLGDTVYGQKSPELGLTGQCLHARKLRFIHPRTGEPVELTTPLPEYFEQILTKLRTRN